MLAETNFLNHKTQHDPQEHNQHRRTAHMHMLVTKHECPRARYVFNHHPQCTHESNLNNYMNYYGQINQRFKKSGQVTNSFLHSNLSLQSDLNLIVAWEIPPKPSLSPFSLALHTVYRHLHYNDNTRSKAKKILKWP